MSIAFLLTGCNSAHARDPAVDLTNLRQQIYSQPPVEFARATLCKPKSDSADEASADLAPIFVLQHPGPSEPFNPCPRNAPASVETSAVYTASTTAMIHGAEYPQHVYVWWPKPGQKEQSAWRALRITFNNDGMPVIWEIIDPAQPILQVYVARSLEQKALDKYKQPLPDRRFAIEQPVDQRPDVVVARVLDDGPVPMGPMIYLRADGHIATIVCRCMPSQVAQIDDTNYYQLAAIENACGMTFNDLTATAAAESPAFAELIDADWLERALRIGSGL